MLKRIDENVLLVSPGFTKQKEYWMKKFSKDMTITGIPPDRNQVEPAIQQDAETGICFPDHLCKRMIQFSKASDLSLYILLLTGTKVLTYGCTGNRDIAVFSPLYQPRINTQTINRCLLIRSTIPGTLTFIEFLLMTRQSVLKAYENQDYPFDKLLEHVFDGASTQRRGKFAGISCSLKNIHPENSIDTLEAKLSFWFGREEGQIKGTLRYDPNLYTGEFARQMARHLVRVLENALENINIKIPGISFLSKKEKRRLIFDFNNTREKYPRNKTLQQLFEAGVEKTPHKIALAGSSRYETGQEGTREVAPLSELMSITYKELNEKSHGLAHLLRSRGVKPDTIVGIMLEPSTGMIAGILGILKAGGAYLPIDPGYPGKRIKYMLDDAAVSILLTRSGLMLNMNRLFNGECIRMDRLSLYSSRESNAVVGINRWDHLAYIMYTSGSTGRAKGVMVNHRNVIRLAVNTNYAVLTEKTRILQTGAPVFDATTFEIWGALLNSGILYFTADDVILDANQLGQAIVLYKINTLWLTSPLFNQLAHDNCRIFSPLEQLLVGGDVLSPKYINMVRNRNETLKIINGYGPTENTTFSTTFLIDRDFNGTIPIGKPIRNSTAYIFDKNHRLQPIGVFGELYVGGDGVSRGYLNRIELTAEKFIKYPFPGGKRLYRTGDMARWLTDGTIEFSGRIDNQVKIRGFRIELEEIESLILSYPDVGAAVVLSKEDKDENKYLCAYIIANNEKEIPVIRLREYLLKHLPGYMVPSYFIFISQIPLTPNGKIDKQALPQPLVRAGKKYVPPGDETEEKLMEIWSNVLAIEKKVIGIDDSFFELGGHSLKATILAARVHKELNVKLRLAEIFQHPSVKEMAETIKGLTKDRYVSIEPAEEKEYYKLSSAQNRLYILHQMETGNTSYNMPTVLHLNKGIDKERMQETFRNLISRHGSLRTSFHLVHESSVQKVHKPGDVPLGIEYYETPGIEAVETVINDFIKPFDLSRAPLVRVGLIDPGDGTHILMVDMHHIITDGTSHSVLTKEFLSLSLEEVLPALRLQYKDYSEWENRQKVIGILKKQENFWLKEFRGEIPVLNMPTDYPRPPLQSFEGSAMAFELDEKETAALNEIGRSNGATLFMVLLAIYNILLSKLSSQEDIVVGAPIAGRKHVDLEQIIGMFVNTLPLRCRPSWEHTFTSFLGTVREKALKAFENQGYQFEDLVEKLLYGRDMSRNPLFDAVFVLQNFFEEPGNIESENIEPPPVETYTFESRTSKFDLSLNVFETGERLIFSCEYCTKLFRAETIARFIEYFKNITAAVVENPGVRIPALEIIPGEEKKRVLTVFNDTKTGFPKNKTIHELFEEQVAGIPDRIALEGTRGFAPLSVPISVTYNELNRRSDQLAHLLIEKGVRPDTIVALMIERSIEMIVGILGILKAGGAYLPIDLEYPEERKQYMLDDSGAKILLTRQEIADVFSPQALYNRPKATSIQPSTLLSFYPSNPSNLAYVIYTSGSTGRPRGVVIGHRNVVRLVKNSNIIDFKSTDKLLLTGSIGFDITTFEVWGPLLNGSVLCLVDQGAIMDAEILALLIQRHKISILHLIPQLFNQLAERNQDIFTGLAYFLVGGDLVQSYYINQLRKGNKNLKILHMYGPTENTTFSTVFPVERPYEITIPIGKPIANSCAYIIDKYDKLVPIGVPGELVVGGDGVSRGYLNNPGLTAEKFDCDLWDYLDYHDGYHRSNRSYRSYFSYMSHIYRTGDLARWLPDRNIEFLGRRDHQVKIRGIRIELEEIESLLLHHEKVKEALVIDRKRYETKADGIIEEKYLCAYIVAVDEEAFRNLTATASELREYLSVKLPDYMLPSYFIGVDGIPLTANGKIDRNALPEPGITIEEKKGYIAPRNHIEEKLVETWSKILKIEKEKIGIDANFFLLGGHSLKAAVMAAQIHKELNIKLSLPDVFKRPTIRELSEHLSASAEEKYVSIEPAEEKEYYELSSAQKRLYVLQQMETRSTGYNMTFMEGFHGELHRKTFEKTFEKLIKRYDSLRTSFEMIDEEPVQKIWDNAAFEMDYYDLSQEVNGGKDSENSISRDFVRAFDLSRAPLLRVGLIKQNPLQHLLMLDIHHIITDGTSHKILIRDFMILLKGEELPRLRLQYKDYSQWQRSQKVKEAFKKQEKYWLRQFQGEIPLVNMPCDYPRPAIQSFAGRLARFQLEEKESRALNEIARSQGATLFMVLLAVYYIFLSKLSSQEDVVVGTPVAGRRHADLEKIIGVFVNTLALRNQPLGFKTFSKFLSQVKERTLQAFDHQDYPFEDLVNNTAVERDLSRNPLFDVMFSLVNFLDTPAQSSNRQGVKGLAVNSYNFEYTTSRFDLTLSAAEVKDQIAFTIEYSTSLFRQETMQRFISYFKEVVNAVSVDPMVPIADIEIITGEEKKQLLLEFNDTAVDYPADKLIHQLVEEQVQKTPHHIAVLGTSLSLHPGKGKQLRKPLTYREMDQTSNQLARLLKTKGVQSETIVGLMVERSLEMMVGILSIMKAGAAYLPIDPVYPPERIAYILEDSGASVILTDKTFKSHIKEGYEMVELDEPHWYGSPGENKNTPGHQRERVGKSTDLVYVIYTSGSTGRPKGVTIRHRSLANFIKGMTDIIDFTGSDSILSLTTITFDIFGLETILPLTQGSKVVIGTGEEQLNAGAAALAISEEDITILQVTPSRLSLLLSHQASLRGLKDLKYLLVGGEAFPGELLERVWDTREGKIFNVYGPTETTIWSTVKDVTKGELLNIGKPIANTFIYIVDKNEHLQPIGAAGDLWIAGEGLARGYLNQPQLTAAKFAKKVPGRNNYMSPGSYMAYIYLTGDLARWLPDGNIEFIGRKDHQVKIRGFRIELEEIETQLTKHKNIKKVVVVCQEDESEDKSICAYYVPPEGRGSDQGPAEVELREYLADKLPVYMVPSYFIRLEQFPLTPNGKIDRKKLPRPSINIGENHVAPRDEIEKKLARLWAGVLGKDVLPGSIGIDDNFFHLGGHSLSATVLITKIHKELNVTLPLTDIFKTPTIRGLSGNIKGLVKSTYESIEPAEKKEYYILSPVQRRFYALQEMDVENTSFNIPNVAFIKEKSDRNQMEEAFQKLIDQHDIFRTSFEIIGSDPYQKIHETVQFKIEYFRLKRGETHPGGQPATGSAGPGSIDIREGNREVDEIIARFIRPFYLSDAPLMRVGIIEISSSGYILMMDIHHIIADGLSTGLLVERLIGLLAGEELSRPRLQYKDFSEWQNTEKIQKLIKKQENYWLKIFEKGIVELNLPLDYVRPAVQSFEGDAHWFEIEAAETIALKQLAREGGTTLYMVILAIFNIMLANVCGQETIPIGTGTAGRGHTDLQQMIGTFQNMVVLINYTTREKTFMQFLEEVKNRTLEAFENQDYQFEELVKKVSRAKDTGRNPLFDVFLILNNMDTPVIPTADTGGTERMVDMYPRKITRTRFDLGLYGEDAGTSLYFYLEYCTKLFRVETIRRLIGYFKIIISTLLENKDIKLKDIEIPYTLSESNDDFSREDYTGFKF